MIEINYVTSSKFKREENKVFAESCSLSNKKLVKDVFSFRLYELDIPERLEVDLVEMVKFEVIEAYKILRIPCIVEHAGLIFNKYIDRNYPGGLTKPLWNTLEEDFLLETNSANTEVTARAVVGYCDGREISTFIGETKGVLSSMPKGDRNFYWDTVFIPDKKLNLTYAEIVANKGLAVKLTEYSQSSRAMLNFLEYRLKNNIDDFWS